MIYLSSDLHGFPLSVFQTFLVDSGFTRNDTLIVLGDVIDRNGDGGIAMLRWIMHEPHVHMILGNHEALMLSCTLILFPITDHALSSYEDKHEQLLGAWLENGGEPTMYTLHALNKTEPDTVHALFTYLKNLPLYRFLRIGSRRFLLTHAGLGHFQSDKALKDYTARELLWNRPQLTDVYFTDIFTVFGHTPTIYYGPEYADRMILTRTWADIDTGASSGRNPMLLRLDDMKTFYL